MSSGKYLTLAAVGLITAIVIGNTRNQSGSGAENGSDCSAGRLRLRPRRFGI